MIFSKKYTFLLLACCAAQLGFSQSITPAVVVPATPKVPELRFNFNESGSHFVKFTFTNQVWLRYAQVNNGSTVGGVKVNNVADIGLRRTRMQLFGKTSDHTFFYLQIGQNNFNYVSDRKVGFFIHDALGQIDVDKHLSLGAGLTAWTGFARYSSPGVASIMGLDAPLYQQATNDANDQFLRKLSVYAKGKIGKLDYRLIASKPFTFTKSSVYSSSKVISYDAQFNTRPPAIQGSAYLSYQFKDQESNETPYQVGTYLGKKRIFNIGAGVQYQKNAVWYLNAANATDTIQHNMLLAAVDAYFDTPLNSDKGTALSVYCAASYYDLGRNYIRNQGPMSPTDGGVSSLLNGGGVAFPMIGTGNTLYAQLGYLSSNLSKTKSIGRLMPYASAQFSDYDKLKSTMFFYDLGCSWYLDGARSKLTLALQNRPGFDKLLLTQTERYNVFLLQYQVSI